MKELNNVKWYNIKDLTDKIFYVYPRKRLNIGEIINMKKIKAYRQINVQGKMFKELVEGEKVFNDNLLMYTIKSPRTAIIIDIKTGLSVVSASTKVEAMKRFKEREESYNTIVNDKKYYNKIIKDFNILDVYIEEAKEVIK